MVNLYSLNLAKVISSVLVFSKHSHFEDILKDVRSVLSLVDCVIYGFHNVFTRQAHASVWISLHYDLCLESFFSFKNTSISFAWQVCIFCNTFCLSKTGSLNVSNALCKCVNFVMYVFYGHAFFVIRFV